MTDKKETAAQNEENEQQKAERIISEIIKIFVENNITIDGVCPEFCVNFKKCS